jgi:hypothetical protein
LTIHVRVWNGRDLGGTSYRETAAIDVKKILLLWLDVRGLAALALVETDILVPGHGPLWRGPTREAIEQAIV